MVKCISSSAFVGIFPSPNRSNFAAHLPHSGLPVHMHVSPQGHCGYLDFAHSLSLSAGVHFLTTGRFCWNYPQMRTVRPPNCFTLADIMKGSAPPLRSMEISSQTISFAAHITSLTLDFFLISQVGSGLVAKFSGSFRQLWAVRPPSSKVVMMKH